MARVKDLWWTSGTPKRKTARHPDNGGNPSASRWLACWIGPDGRERTRAFPTKARARQYAEDMEADARRGTYVEPRAARTTVREWCATWLAGYRTRRPKTVRSAQVHIAKILDEFGDLPLSAVRPSHVRAWCARLKDEGAAPSYVHALHGRLSQIMSDAVHDGLLVRSPCSRRTSPGAGKQRPYVATTAQVWALYDAMGERYRAAILLAAFAGLRAAEACGLRVADVDFLRGVISPAVQYPADELKTEVSRTPIPIPRLLAERLSAHVQHERRGARVQAGTAHVGFTMALVGGSGGSCWSEACSWRFAGGSSGGSNSSVLVWSPPDEPREPLGEPLA